MKLRHWRGISPLLLPLSSGQCFCSSLPPGPSFTSLPCLSIFESYYKSLMSFSSTFWLTDGSNFSVRRFQVHAQTCLVTYLSLSWLTGLCFPDHAGHRSYFLLSSCVYLFKRRSKKTHTHILRYVPNISQVRWDDAGDRCSLPVTFLWSRLGMSKEQQHLTRCGSHILMQTNWKQEEASSVWCSQIGTPLDKISKFASQQQWSKVKYSKVK